MSLLFFKIVLYLSHSRHCFIKNTYTYTYLFSMTHSFPSPLAGFEDIFSEISLFKIKPKWLNHWTPRLPTFIKDQKVAAIQTADQYMHMISTDVRLLSSNDNLWLTSAAYSCRFSNWNYDKHTEMDFEKFENQPSSILRELGIKILETLQNRQCRLHQWAL